MPQDSLRSVVYRSFVTCDDPKGVVECSTIRRSKGKGKNKDHKTKGSSSTSTSNEEERADSITRGSTEELQNLSTFQIREVSKGAEKLNDVIGSWSNGVSFDKESKFIAKDLLKGALHLQESLLMLGKLQEASRLMAKPKNMNKERAVGRRVDGEEVGLMDSDRFGDDDRAIVCQKSRSSVDQSPRDCYDELREVIRESFARQNLLPKVSASERDFLDRKSLDSGVDFPSTSSSQSSLIPGHSSDCSPSIIQREKPKGSNLIAKLMGLDEVASKAPSLVVHKQFPKEKLPNQRSYLVDIDLARPRKPQFMVQKAVRESRTLEEMMDTMQFKGLLGRNFDGSDLGEDFSDICLSEKHSAVEDPPIVIMKPRQASDLRAKEFHANCQIYEENPVDCRRITRKRMEEFPPCIFDVPRAQLKFVETNGKLPAGITPRRKGKEDKEPRLSGESPARLFKKTLDSQNNLSSLKINQSRTLATKVQKKEEIVKKINFAMQGNYNRTHAETKDDKFQVHPKTQDPGKTTTSKLSKAARGSNVAKVQAAQGEKTATEKQTRPKSPKSSIPKKTLQKSKRNSKTSTASVKDMQDDDNLRTNIETQILEPLRSATSEKIIKEVVNASYDPLPDNSGDASSCSESSGSTIKVDVKHIEDGICSPCPASEEIKDSKSITNTKYLLLSSTSFLHHAKKLSDTGPCDPTISPTTWLLDGEIDTSILLDCAEEILECKSLHRAINPLSHNLTTPKCYLSLDQLAGEICDEIEELRNYSKSCGDRVNSILERDLSMKGGVTGTWGLGWGNCFTVDQVNEVATAVEKLVLSETVDDVLAQLTFW